MTQLAVLEKSSLNFRQSGEASLDSSNTQASYEEGSVAKTVVQENVSQEWT